MRKHNSPEFFYKFESFNDPGSIHKVNMEDFKNELVERPYLLGNKYIPSDFITTQKFYHSKDGTRIPMFIVMSKETYKYLKKSENPKPRITVMTSYGAFGVS